MTQNFLIKKFEKLTLRKYYNLGFISILFKLSHLSLYCLKFINKIWSVRCHWTLHYLCLWNPTDWTRAFYCIFYLLFSLSWSARTCLMNLINYVKIFPKFQLLFTIKRGCILIFNSLERPDSKHIIQLILSILAPSIFILIYANYMNAFVHKIPDLCSCWIAGGRLDCPQRLQGLQGRWRLQGSCSRVCDDTQGSCWNILLYALVISSVSQNILSILPSGGHGIFRSNVPK